MKTENVALQETVDFTDLSEYPPAAQTVMQLYTALSKNKIILVRGPWEQSPCYNLLEAKSQSYNNYSQLRTI